MFMNKKFRSWLVIVMTLLLLTTVAMPAFATEGESGVIAIEPITDENGNVIYFEFNGDGEGIYFDGEGFVVDGVEFAGTSPQQVELLLAPEAVGSGVMFGGVAISWMIVLVLVVIIILLVLLIGLLLLIGLIVLIVKLIKGRKKKKAKICPNCSGVCAAGEKKCSICGAELK